MTGQGAARVEEEQEEGQEEETGRISGPMRRGRLVEMSRAGVAQEGTGDRGCQMVREVTDEDRFVSFRFVHVSSIPSS